MQPNAPLRLDSASSNMDAEKDSSIGKGVKLEQDFMLKKSGWNKAALDHIVQLNTYEGGSGWVQVSALGLDERRLVG